MNSFYLPLGYISIIPLFYLAGLLFFGLAFVALKKVKPDWSTMKRFLVSGGASAFLVWFFTFSPVVYRTVYQCASAKWSVHGDVVQLVFDSSRKFKRFKDERGFEVRSAALVARLKKEKPKSVNACMALKYYYGSLQGWDLLRSKVDGVVFRYSATLKARKALPKARKATPKARKATPKARKATPKDAQKKKADVRKAP